MTEQSGANEVPSPVELVVTHTQDLQDVPQRVVIRRDPTRATGLRPVSELAERTPIGDAYLQSLVRTQLLLSLRFLLVLVTLLISAPLILIVWPNLRRTQFIGVPIAWFVLGVGVYLLFALVAVAFVRRAGRTEAEFVELVGDPRTDPRPEASTRSRTT